MHPILSHRQRRHAYLVGWLPVAALLAVLLVETDEVSWAMAAVLALPLTYLLAFVSLSAWYLCRALPLDATETLRLAVPHAVAALLSAALWVALAGAGLAAVGRLTGDPALPARLGGLVPIGVGIGAVLYAAATAVHYAVASFEDARRAERTALERETLARRAELAALRAQINPHFLYNSLNAVAGLTVSEPAAARRMCVLLASFFRETMRLGGQITVPLADELALVRSFLAIEQVRFGDRLCLSEEVEEASLAVPVPPLVLQPLAENAVIHGVARLPDGGAVRLEASVHGTSLRLAVENDWDGERGDRGVGLGLNNVRRRLESHFGGNATLQVQRGDGRFRVVVSIPAGASVARAAAR